MPIRLKPFEGLPVIGHKAHAPIDMDAILKCHVMREPEGSLSLDPMWTRPAGTG